MSYQSFRVEMIGFGEGGEGGVGGGRRRGGGISSNRSKEEFVFLLVELQDGI